MDYYPGYYPAFHCLAGDCPDSCCRGWIVTVDPAAEERYRSLPGELGDELRRVMVKSDGELILENNHESCPLWRDDGLCRIHAELGEEALCEVCRSFPRITRDYGFFRELDLTLCCPEAARLILGWPVEAPDTPRISDPLEDALLDRLMVARKSIFTLLTMKSVPESLALVLMFGAHAQAAMDGEPVAGPFDISRNLEKAKTLAKPGDPTEFLAYFRGLSHLGPEFPLRLSAPDPAPWREIHRRLAAYFLRRFLLQGILDADVYGRVKLAIVSVLAVRMMGGNQQSTAQLYAKEIESDPDNIDAILEAAYASPALTDDKLLGMIWQTV